MVGPTLAVLDAEANCHAVEDKAKDDDKDEIGVGVRVAIRLSALNEESNELPSVNEQVTYLHIVRFGTPPTGIWGEREEDNKPWVVKVIKREATFRSSTATVCFLRLWEVERAASATPPAPRRVEHAVGRASANHGSLRWNKAQWEAQWEGTLLQDVPVRWCSCTSTALPTWDRDTHPAPASEVHMPASRVPSRRPNEELTRGQCVNALDPLHVPLPVAFSLSLLEPTARTRRWRGEDRIALSTCPAERLQGE